MNLFKNLIKINTKKERKKTEALKKEINDKRLDLLNDILKDNPINPTNSCRVEHISGHYNEKIYFDKPDNYDVDEWDEQSSPPSLTIFFVDKLIPNKCAHGQTIVCAAMPDKDILQLRNRHGEPVYILVLCDGVLLNFQFACVPFFKNSLLVEERFKELDMHSHSVGHSNLI